MPTVAQEGSTTMPPVLCNATLQYPWAATGGQPPALRVSVVRWDVIPFPTICDTAHLTFPVDLQAIVKLTSSLVPQFAILLAWLVP